MQRVCDNFTNGKETGMKTKRWKEGVAELRQIAADFTEEVVKENEVIEIAKAAAKWAKQSNGKVEIKIGKDDSKVLFDGKPYRNMTKGNSIMLFDIFREAGYLVEPCENHVCDYAYDDIAYVYFPGFEKVEDEDEETAEKE